MQLERMQSSEMTFHSEVDTLKLIHELEVQQINVEITRPLRERGQLAGMIQLRVVPGAGARRPIGEGQVVVHICALRCPCQPGGPAHVLLEVTGVSCVQ